MKNCEYCGKDYPDDLDVCPTDGKPLKRIGEAQPSEPQPPTVEHHDAVSRDEQRFWERITLRQFGILIVRLQALWLLFNAAVEATYLSRYVNLRVSSSVSSYSALSPAARLDLLMLILRIIMQVAAALFILQHAERVLGWLAKDLVAKSPPDQSQETKAAALDS